MRLSRNELDNAFYEYLTLKNEADCKERYDLFRAIQFNAKCKALLENLFESAGYDPKGDGIRRDEMHVDDFMFLENRN